MIFMEHYFEFRIADIHKSIIFQLKLFLHNMKKIALNSLIFVLSCYCKVIERSIWIVINKGKTDVKKISAAGKQASLKRPVHIN